MGEYEDRYPEAYRDNESLAQSSPGFAPAPRQTREQPLRTPFGATATRAAPEPTASGVMSPQSEASWQPAQNEGHNARGAAAYMGSGGHRGVGPRGYTRSPGRIYEDICDRLTDDPFIDASDIDVAVGTAGVVLAGSVATEDMLQRAETRAREVTGVVRLQNRLTVGPERTERAAHSIDR
jgi:osmotically-inducible protein OsmY